MTTIPRALLPLLLPTALGCVAEPTPEKTRQRQDSFADEHANPASSRIPEPYLAHARERAVVAIAGTGSGTEAREWAASGLGTPEQPIRRQQSLEAVTALHELSGSGSGSGRAGPRRIWAWGWPEVDPARPYSYRALSGTLFEVRFLTSEGVAPAYGDLTTFTESSALDDATRLRRALDGSAPSIGERVMLVGFSWGAAVVDYGLTRTPSREPAHGVDDAILGDVVAIAIAGPKDVPTTLGGWPFIGMSPTGEARPGFLLLRRPDDYVGKGGLWPALSGLAGPTHNYTMAWHEDRAANLGRQPGGFWGISGPGLLCSAAFEDNCP